MWIHGPKGNASLCQSAAASTVHGHRAVYEVHGVDREDRMSCFAEDWLQDDRVLIVMANRKRWPIALLTIWDSDL